MRPVVLSALSVVLVLLAGCADTPGSGTPEVEGTWTLTAGQGPQGEVPLDGEVTVTLDIDGTRWGGSVCNTYSGTARAEADGTVSWPEPGLSVTEMACPDDEVMRAEAVYVDALPRVTTWSIVDDQLTLTGEDVNLRYARVPPVEDAAVVGTRWVLDGLVDGDGPDAAVSQATADAELELSDDGRLTVTTGCNEGSASARLEGDRLVLDGPLVTTDLACEEPIAAQEQQVLAVLGDDPHVTVDGDRLTVTGDARGLHYRAADG